MDIAQSKSEFVADSVFKQMSEASQRPGSENTSDKLYSTLVQNPGAIPLLAKKLEASKLDHDFVKMVNWLAASQLGLVFEPLRPIQKYISEMSSGFPKKIFDLDQARSVGQEKYWLSVAQVAIDGAQSQADLYLVMMRCVFGLNKIGQHKRAQCCALIAYEVSQGLETKAFIQRSEFAILHSTRLIGGIDLSAEYARVCRQLVSGKLEYEEVNQNLTPTYAAMHQMDLRHESKELRALLSLSKEYACDEFALLNYEIALAHYYCLTGRRKKAKIQLHELAERVCLSKVDMPVLGPMLKLKEELGASEVELTIPSMEPASKKMWRHFDLMVDRVFSNWQQKFKLGDQL